MMIRMTNRAEGTPLTSERVTEIGMKGRMDGGNENKKWQLGEERKLEGVDKGVRR